MTPTADLCDAHPDAVRVAAPGLLDFGGLARFYGPVQTVRCYEDNTQVRAQLETPGEGRVLVVAGGGSRWCALLGGDLGALAVENGWAGVVVDGCVRDVDELRPLKVGIRAWAACPRKSRKLGTGEVGVPVDAFGIRIAPGDHLWADTDGIIVADRDLDAA